MPAHHQHVLSDGNSANWAKLGEDVGRGTTLEAIHDALMASPSQRANILDPSFDALGVGVVWTGQTFYIAQEFMQG